jgi:alkanesulfonate monooxygenase SsuD/methylene tetrahydromethanopterin reductase-like flavin-dependent oxidoreductase (luciferase family)/pimeloyl-ACP methyl ester carboxylesterase
VTDSPLTLPVGIAVGQASRPFSAAVALAAEAEAAGADFISVGDSGAETFALLGAVAQATSRVGLMSGIATWSRSPVTMAHAAATVQNLSEGRYTLGIGPMPRLWAQSWHGLEYQPVLARMREYLTAVRACLDADADHPTAQPGRYVRTVGFPGHALQPPRRVPMMLAATLPGMVRLAAELTDGVMLNSIQPLDWITGPGAGLIASGAERGGRDRGQLQVGLMRFCAVDDDRAAAYDAVRRSIAFYFAIPYFRTLLEPFGFADELAAGEAAVAAGDADAGAAAVSDAMVAQLAIAGTPAEVVEQIGAYGEHADWLQLAAGFNQPAAAGGEQVRRVIAVIAAGRAAARAAADTRPAAGASGRPRPGFPRAAGADQPATRRGYAGPDGAQVHYRERGSGLPVVLLHQTASSSVMWERVMAAFGAGYRLLALDTPGFGGSDPLAVATPTIADYADRVAAALAALGIVNAIVVGHHTGAVIATELAAGAPEIARGVVLLGPVVIADLAEQEEQLAGVCRWEIDARGDWVRDRIIPRLHLSVTRDDPVHMEREMIAYLQAGADYADAYQAVYAYRAAERLPLIEAPLLCAVGDREIEPLQRWARAARSVVPGARHVTLGELGSEMAFEEPRRVADLIMAFARGIDDPRNPGRTREIRDGTEEDAPGLVHELQPLDGLDKSVGPGEGRPRVAER